MVKIYKLTDNEDSQDSRRTEMNAEDEVNCQSINARLQRMNLKTVPTVLQVTANKPKYLCSPLSDKLHVANLEQIWQDDNEMTPETQSHDHSGTSSTGCRP